jgi:phosphoglycerate dehydrogenase-like enzyme
MPFIQGNTMHHLALRIAILSIVVGSTIMARAEVTIDVLIEEAGLRDGPVAMRDVPGWRPPRKIVVWSVPGIQLTLDDSMSGVRLVQASSVAEVLAEAPDADAIIGICNQEVAAAAKQAVWIQQYASGAERCLLAPDVADGRIVMTNMQKMSSPVIAEHAIAMMLSLGRGITQYAKTMQSGDWNRRPESFSMTSFGGRTMLVVGLGGIGTETAKRAAALGMTVIATRNSSRQGPDYVSYVGLSGELFELAVKADVIVNALPLTAATRGLFNSDFFDVVKPGAYFINVARGGSVVTDDLIAALDSGQLAGAGLDVTDPEPLPPDHRLWKMQNVIITPHVAAAASERERHQAVAQENLRRFVAGDALLNVVDPARGY